MRYYIFRVRVPDTDDSGVETTAPAPGATRTPESELTWDYYENRLHGWQIQIADLADLHNLIAIVGRIIIHPDHIIEIYNGLRE